MPRLVKKLACLTLLALSGQLSWGFALLGPINEAYQVVDIGYNVPGDIGAPKNIGEEYRRNTPTIYYACDANFVDYFGSNGVSEVDAAIAAFNSLQNFSQMSSNLNEFPLQATRENFEAEALGLDDLKSWTMVILTEQLGLAEPERYIWTLHDRYNIPGSTCPAGMLYLVIKRNFDPVMSALNQLQASSYVNGTLYSYDIPEICQPPPATLAFGNPFPVDPLDFSFSAVAGQGNFVGVVGGSGSYAGLALGGKFFLGLTRDDVGGLRYLYSTNLMHFESTGPNTLASVTNPIPQLLFTSNLTQFAEQALTNPPANLQAIYPNLNIINTSNYFVNVLVTNITAYFTNFPWSPAGVTAIQFATNVVPTIQTRYVETFGNLLILTQTPTGPGLVPLIQLPPPNGQAIVTIETDTIGTSADPFGAAGAVTIRTNSTFSTFLTNAVTGDFAILPTNFCSVEVLATQLTWVTAATNFIGAATNSQVFTNALGLTNAGTTLFISQSRITYSTNKAFVVLPVSCVASNVALFQGMNGIRFVRRDFDSLLGRFFTAFTNNYTLNSITNNSLVPQPILRTITGPDILFSAADLASNDGTIPTSPIYARNINFNTNFEGVALAGPGTIEPFTTVTFNKVGPIYENGTPNSFFPDTAEASQFTLRILGSFNGSTNAPVIYPNGTSLVNLENQVLIGISPARLPDGSVGVFYGAGATFTAMGGVTPYTWSLAPGSPGLPPGLSLTSDGVLSGTPTADGTYDFTIRLTEAAGRTVDRGYSITILN
jgi:hypothetical protein